MFRPSIFGPVFVMTLLLSSTCVDEYWHDEVLDMGASYTSESISQVFPFSFLPVLRQFCHTSASNISCQNPSIQTSLAKLRSKTPQVVHAISYSLASGSSCLSPFSLLTNPSPPAFLSPSIPLMSTKITKCPFASGQKPP